MQNNFYWCRQGGHLNEDQAEVLKELSKGAKNILEIGFCTGRSACAIIAGAGAENIQKFVSIDINYNYSKFGRDMVALFLKDFPFFEAHEVNSKDLDSCCYASLFDGNGADFIFIDGGHTYEECGKDLNDAALLLNRNGLIVVDDYMSGPPNGCSLPGVTKACDDFFETSKECFERTIWHKDGKGLCIFKKVHSLLGRADGMIFSPSEKEFFDKIYY